MSQCRPSNTGLSNHQMIFCTRKTKKEVSIGKFLLDHLKSIQLMSMKKLWVK